MKEHAMKEFYKEQLQKIIRLYESDPFKSVIEEEKKRADFDPKKIDEKKNKKLLKQLKDLENIIEESKAYIHSVDI